MEARHIHTQNINLSWKWPINNKLLEHSKEGVGQENDKTGSFPSMQFSICVPTLLHNKFNR